MSLNETPPWKFSAYATVVTCSYYMVQQPKEYFVRIHFAVGSLHVLVIKKHHAEHSFWSQVLGRPQLSCVGMYRQQNIIFGFGENPALDFAYM